MAIFKYLPAGALFFLWIFSSGIKDSLGAVQPGPVITNSNEKAAAYFQLKKVDGTTEIVKVPARSRMMLGPEVEEFQYLYMEGQGSVPALPEISTMALSDLDPDIDTPQDFDLPDFNTGPSPAVAREQEALPKKSEAAQAPKVVEREKEQEKAIQAVLQGVSARIINQSDEVIVVRAILEDDRQHLLVLEANQSMNLPPQTRWVELRPNQKLGFSKKGGGYAVIEKTDGTVIEIPEIGKRFALN